MRKRERPIAIAIVVRPLNANGSAINRLWSLAIFGATFERRPTGQVPGRRSRGGGGAINNGGFMPRLGLRAALAVRASFFSFLVSPATASAAFPEGAACPDW